MAYQVAPLQKLIEHFERLPGIGRKSAQRLAFHVLNMPKERAEDFARCILEAREKIHKCAVCQNLTDEELCPICRDESRDHTTICVVENSQDVLAFERTREYKGVYHVLGGLISPMDGIGPGSAGSEGTAAPCGRRGSAGSDHGNQSHCGGRGHCHVHSPAAQAMGIKVSRLAYGIPVGGQSGIRG